MHDVLATALTECTKTEDVPEWLVEITTILVMKDTKRDSDVENYRPTVFLNLIWKLLKGVIMIKRTIIWRRMDYCQKSRKGTKYYKSRKVVE